MTDEADEIIVRGHARLQPFEHHDDHRAATKLLAETVLERFVASKRYKIERVDSDSWSVYAVVARVDVKVAGVVITIATRRSAGVQFEFTYDPALQLCVLPAFAVDEAPGALPEEIGDEHERARRCRGAASHLAAKIVEVLEHESGRFGR